MWFWQRRLDKWRMLCIIKQSISKQSRGNLEDVHFTISYLDTEHTRGWQQTSRSWSTSNISGKHKIAFSAFYHITTNDDDTVISAIQHSETAIEWLKRTKVDTTKWWRKEERKQFSWFGFFFLLFLGSFFCSPFPRWWVEKIARDKEKSNLCNNLNWIIPISAFLWAAVALESRQSTNEWMNGEKKKTLLRIAIRSK